MKVGDQVHEAYQSFIRGTGTVVRYDDHPLGGKVIDVQYADCLCTYFDVHHLRPSFGDPD